jgi:UDP-N-acetylglucosamine 2-epimerase (non-hydrolysing)
MNRIMAGHLSDLHLAPTSGAAENLRRENILEGIHVVGNTVIDALFLGLDLLKGPKGEPIRQSLQHLPINQRFVLVTGHRRESFGEPFENICHAIAESAACFPDVAFIYPVHLNPNVQEPVHRILDGLSNVRLIEPLDYPHFIWLMERCYVVLTDSGGMQEEAPSLGKPVLVMREVTERQEGIDAGTARLVGTDRKVIVEALHELLSNEEAYQRMAKSVNPYGDGTASNRIATIVGKYLSDTI